LDEPNVVGELATQDLHRNLATQHLVAGHPHLAHATARDPLGQLVAVADPQADLRAKKAHRFHHAPPRIRTSANLLGIRPALC